MKIHKDKEQIVLTVEAYKTRKIMSISIAKAMVELKKLGLNNIEIDYFTQAAFHEVIACRDIFGWDNLPAKIEQMKHGDDI